LVCGAVCGATGRPRPVSGRNGRQTHRELITGVHVVPNDECSMWATTGKQCWRCGVIRKRGYGARVLAHFQILERMLPAGDSRTVVMKAGIR